MTYDVRKRDGLRAHEAPGPARMQHPRDDRVEVGNVHEDPRPELHLLKGRDVTLPGELVFGGAVPLLGVDIRCNHLTW